VGTEWKKAYSIYIYIHTIHIREAAGRSVNGFIKSVFVVVTTAEKNYFSLFFPCARAFSSLPLSFLSVYFSIALSLSLYLSRSLTPTALHVVVVVVVAAAVVLLLLFLLLFLLLLLRTDRRAPPSVRGRNIISSGRGDAVWAVAGVPRMCARGVRRADNWLFPDAHKLRSRTPFSVPAHIMPPANSLILHLPSSQTKLMTLIETAGLSDGMCEPRYWHSSSIYTPTFTYIYICMYNMYILLCVYIMCAIWTLVCVRPRFPPSPSSPPHSSTNPYGQLDTRPPLPRCTSIPTLCLGKSPPEFSKN